MKKYIYQLEKEQHGDRYHDVEAGEQDTLLGGHGANTDSLFESLLNQELKKIVSFYVVQEKELSDEVEELEKLVTRQEEEGPDNYYLDDDEEDEEDDESVSQVPRGSSVVRNASHSPDANRRRRQRSFSASHAHGGESSSRRYSISSDEMPDGPARHGRSRSSGMFGALKDSFTSSVHDTLWTSETDQAYDTRLLFKRKITTLYISLSNLKSYVEANESGFRKILKK